MSLRSEDGHRGRGPDNDANSDKVCLHSQLLAKITETKGLTVLPTGAKARIFRRVSKNCEKWLLASSCVSPSVRPPAWNSAPTERFSWNFIFQHFSKICRENSYNTTRITHISHAAQYTLFDHISLNSSWNKVFYAELQKNQNTHIMSNNPPPPKKNRAVYMGNTVEPDRPLMTIWRKCTAC